MTRILAFAGSARTDSVNKKLVKFASRLVQDQGATVTMVDLRDFPMPLYDGDLEEKDGIPKFANDFYELMNSHQGLLIACPEYNSSITPLLKNTIDWVSRPHEGDPPLAAFKGKICGLVAASPGALGGLRGLVHVRSILGNIGVHVIPTQVALGRAFQVIDDEGQVTDENMVGMLKSMAIELVETTNKMYG